MDVDLREQRHALVERNKLDFGVNHQRIVENPGRPIEHHQFSSLNVGLEKVRALHLRDIVKSSGLDLVCLLDAGQFLEVLEFGEQGGVWLEQ